MRRLPRGSDRTILGLDRSNSSETSRGACSEIDVATLREEVAQLRRFTEADRRDPSELTVAMTGAITVTAAPAGPDRPPLTGTPEQIVEGLNQYAEAGLQHLVATIRAEGDASLDATRAAMEQVAREVRPALAAGGAR